MRNKWNKTNISLAFGLFFVVGIFIFSLFKNIQYPLMWGDEADTALFAERILKFGYPKVHDGPNTLFLTGENLKTSKLDITLHPSWLQYYLAVPGAFFAGKVDDFYLKTAILRIPFALMGLLGVIILPFSVWKLFYKKTRAKLLFLVFYFMIQTTSVSLILHFREVRTYSLVVLLSSLIVYFFINYYFFGQKRNLASLLSISFLLILLLFSMFQVTYILIFSFVAFMIFDHFFLKNLRKNTSIANENDTSSQKRKNIIKAIAPLVILTLPFAIFFGLLSNSAVYYSDMSYNTSVYFLYISRIFSYLNNYHYLILYILLESVLLILWRGYKKKIHEEYSEIVVKGIRISFYSVVLLLSYILIISRTPWLFDRYYIFLQPLLTVMILLNGFLVFGMVGERKVTLFYLQFLFAVVFLVTSIGKIPVIQAYWFQLNNRYMGPIDVIVEFLKQRYHDSSNLKIYTNIEQLPLIYYLRSRAACEKNIYCFNEPPDIIIPRRYLETPPEILEFLSKYEYQKVMFNILDYPVNNIPEFSLSLHHLFKTPITNDGTSQLFLYVLKNEQL